MNDRSKEQSIAGPEELVDIEGGTLAVLARAEINQQIATAKAYPRSVTEFAREAQQLATLNEEMARACVYALPRGGKTIEGPSARFAEIMAYSFRNMRYGARPISEEGEFITSQGVAYDLERNNGVTIEVRRRITNSSGDRFNADMIGVTANAANSIALRNAVLKIIPKALWNPIYQKARGVIMGDFETFNNRLGKVFEEFQRYGVTKEMVCVKLDKKGVQDLKIEDMVVLAGMLTALQEGDSTPEQMFAVSMQGAGIQGARERVDETKKDAKTTETKPKRESKAEKAAREAREADDAALKAKKTTEDAQGAVGGTPTPAATQQQGGAATANMLKQIELRIESYGIDTSKMLGHFGCTKLEELQASQVNGVLKWIEENGD